MRPTETSPTRAAFAFQLVAALGLYRTQLDELDRAGIDASSRCLANLTEGLRSIRVNCAPFPSLRVWFVELLIGHSELVFLLGQGDAHADAARGKPRSLLVAEQRRRVENLMRNALHPLSEHDAANDPAAARDHPAERP